MGKQMGQAKAQGRTWTANTTMITQQEGASSAPQAGEAQPAGHGPGKQGTRLAVLAVVGSTSSLPWPAPGRPWIGTPWAPCCNGVRHFR